MLQVIEIAKGSIVKAPRIDAHAVRMGAKLRKHLKSRGIKLDFVAAKCGISSAFFNRILEGQRYPSKRVARAIDRFTLGAFPWRRWEKPKIRRSRTRKVRAFVGIMGDIYGSHEGHAGGRPFVVEPADVAVSHDAPE